MGWTTLCSISAASLVLCIRFGIERDGWYFASGGCSCLGPRDQIASIYASYGRRLMTRRPSQDVSFRKIRL